MINQIYDGYCGNRLPCGVCRLTNSMCPKAVAINITCGDSTWSQLTITNGAYATDTCNSHTNPEDSYRE